MSAPPTTAPRTPHAAAQRRPSLIGHVENGWAALIAEFVGTAALVFFAVGTAVYSGVTAGTVGIALAFGFVLVALVYAIGSVSGCHVNPAVTLGMVLARRMNPICGGLYAIAQFCGGIVGALLLYWVSNTVLARTGGPFNRKSFGANGYGSDSDLHISVGGAFLVEIILTALLIIVVLGVTHGPGVKGLEGVAIGTALTAIHLVGIPLTGTSVNPARSLGPAIFAETNALSQVWLFIVAPLCGAVLGVLVHTALRGYKRSVVESKPVDRASAE
ncbi:aquaporin [Actinospica sp. MGRD01-02]|uniref:Aquaporin n=1 Tax=Actinospica acidithermotolerans TaxID=2828514 RepID=A0A941EHK8_9ACTN|nr:aquaporin [Actinospica acidithermotolerans]MBR7829239.1 aquaporin [Actinospica acidithermotolerans]